MKRYKSDLDFLENYWKDAKAIADKIKNELPLGTCRVLAMGGIIRTKADISTKAQ